MKDKDELWFFILLMSVEVVSKTCHQLTKGSIKSITICRLAAMQKIFLMLDMFGSNLIRQLKISRNSD